jgi:hypothetical protein
MLLINFLFASRFKEIRLFGTCYAKLLVGKREQGTGNREQGKERIFCHDIQKYGSFLIHSKLYEIFLFRFCILCTQEPEIISFLNIYNSNPI